MTAVLEDFFWWDKPDDSSRNSVCQMEWRENLGYFFEGNSLSANAAVWLSQKTWTTLSMRHTRWDFLFYLLAGVKLLEVLVDHRREKKHLISSQLNIKEHSFPVSADKKLCPEMWYFIVPWLGEDWSVLQGYGDTGRKEVSTRLSYPKFKRYLRKCLRNKTFSHMLN